ncbi:MAG TPA: hypothetical protein VNB22_17020 [Pyrinomonadaceae bacterium]|jgi:hypothetical protein|nr:hypothetical protein [Pyrinomonadaceae bacterium]
MKRILSVILILILSSFIFAQSTAIQQKPLTQAEYVKMLYDVQKTPGNIPELIETIRTRGIGFVLTDGIRGLTRTKGANNEELKRTLEEADRRRQNPAESKLPSEKEAIEIWTKAQAANLAAIEEMPDFVVKQLISRSAAYAGTNNWKSLDRLIVAVSYSTEKGEQYQVLALNGTRVIAEKGGNYGGLSGATTSGEFVVALEKLFKTESKTTYKLIDTDLIRNRKAFVFEYEIAIENNKSGALGFGDTSPIFIQVGQKGKVWIDRETFRVLRNDYQATDIPRDFPIRVFSKLIDYDWVEISGAKYLLPASATGIFTTQEGQQLFQDKNLIRFKEYQKYGSEVKILDGDEEEVKDEEKPKQ